MNPHIQDRELRPKEAKELFKVRQELKKDE
jgi:hypothetical protein